MRNISIGLLLLAATTCMAGRNAKPTTVSRLSATDQRQFDYYFYEGLRLKDNQKPDEALQMYRYCLSLDSLNGGANAEAGILYAMAGKTGEAIHCMERAVSADSRNWWFNLQLISLYGEEKKWKKAIETAVALQKNYPNREEVYTMLATLYQQNKQYDKAIAALDRLEALAGIDQSTSFQKFQLYIMSNKAKKGIAEIDKLVNKYPTDSRYKVLRGEIYMQQQMPAKAFEIYQQVLKSDPQNATVYVSLSEYYNQKSQPDSALQAIVMALKADGLEPDTKIQILDQYVEKLVRDSTRFVETESLFKLLVDKYPLEEQVHSYYAKFLQYQKRNKEVISELETMLNINSKNTQTWLRLIQTYIDSKDFKQMLAVADKALLTLPAEPSLYFYKGIGLFQINDYKGALETYKAGLPTIADDQLAFKSDFYAQIGDTYFKMEQKDSAFANYEKALEANPKNVMVMNNYAYYLSLEKKDLKRAERMSAKTVELEPKNSTYLDTYAWILYQQESYTLAKFYIERAVDNLSNEEEHGVVLEHYGDILWMTRDDEKAMQFWKKSYESGNKTDDLKKKIDNNGWKRPEEAK